MLHAYPSAITGTPDAATCELQPPTGPTTRPSDHLDSPCRGCDVGYLYKLNLPSPPVSSGHSPRAAFSAPGAAVAGVGCGAAGGIGGPSRDEVFVSPVIGEHESRDGQGTGTTAKKGEMRRRMSIAWLTEDQPERKLPPCVQPMVKAENVAYSKILERAQQNMKSHFEATEHLEKVTVAEVGSAQAARPSLHTRSLSLSSTSSTESAPTSPLAQPRVLTRTKERRTSTTRRKRWCPICRGLYSNLAAHRAAHISDDDRPHTCDECGRAFARQNDLMRHRKTHRGDAPYVCPFYVEHEHNDCHVTGKFSRCDTYKNHLKSMHFVYPQGTRRTDRREMPGRCRECRKEFGNASQWIQNHVAAGECPALNRSALECSGLYHQVSVEGDTGET